MKKILLIILLYLILFIPNLINAQTSFLTGPGTTNIQGFNTNGLVGYWKLGMNYSGSTILGNYSSDSPNLTKSGTTIVNDPEYGFVRYFDGVDDFLFLETLDDEQGILSYQGNDTITAKFRDAGQDFSEWVSIGSAKYMLVVTNNDATVSWGYCEVSDQASDINIYTDIDLATRGWKGTLPVVGGKTPSTYEVRRTDFQIISHFTVGMWINLKTESTYDIPYFFGKRDSQGPQNNGFFVRWNRFTNEIRFFMAADGILTFLSYVIDLENVGWKFLTFKYDGTKRYIYVNGEEKNSAAYSTDPEDSFEPLFVGSRYDQLAQGMYHGEMADVFIYNHALSAIEIKRIYDHPPRIVTEIR